MAEDLIRYDILTQEALRGVVRKVLGEVSRAGLPGEHHFFITFETRFPGVRISARMLEQYPEEMTIVIQHQYWELLATEDRLEIGLSFNEIPERLVIPYAAVKGFYDPSVQFGLQFELDVDAREELGMTAKRESPVKKLPLETVRKDDPPKKPAKAAKKAADKPDANKDDAAATDDSADVVSLDSFRNKKN